MDVTQNDWEEDEPSDAKRFKVRKQKYYTPTDLLKIYLFIHFLQFKQQFPTEILICDLKMTLLCSANFAEGNDFIIYFILSYIYFFIF